mgnify:CR=1 FL=1
MKGTRGLWTSIGFVLALTLASLIGFASGALRPILGLDLEGRERRRLAHGGRRLDVGQELDDAPRLLGLAARIGKKPVDNTPYVHQVKADRSHIGRALP